MLDHILKKTGDDGVGVYHRIGVGAGLEMVVVGVLVRDFYATCRYRYSSGGAAGFPRPSPQLWKLALHGMLDFGTFRTEGQPSSTHFLFQQLLVVATRVGAPV